MSITHQGFLVGVDSRTSPEFRRRIYLRETKFYWMDSGDVRWRKSDGHRTPRESFPMFRLDLSSITAVSNS
jgi:hypothetical protein